MKPEAYIDNVRCQNDNDAIDFEEVAEALEAVLPTLQEVHAPFPNGWNESAQEAFSTGVEILIGLISQPPPPEPEPVPEPRFPSVPDFHRLGLETPFPTSQWENAWSVLMHVHQPLSTSDVNALWRAVESYPGHNPVATVYALLSVR